ncbi:hypothetical protein D3C85_922650 [compost metagenome]
MGVSKTVCDDLRPSRLGFELGPGKFISILPGLIRQLAIIVKSKRIITVIIFTFVLPVDQDIRKLAVIIVML